MSILIGLLAIVVSIVLVWVGLAVVAIAWAPFWIGLGVARTRGRAWGIAAAVVTLAWLIFLEVAGWIPNWYWLVVLVLPVLFAHRQRQRQRTPAPVVAAPITVESAPGTQKSPPRPAPRRGQARSGLGMVVTSVREALEYPPKRQSGE